MRVLLGLAVSGLLAVVLLLGRWSVVTLGIAAVRDRHVPRLAVTRLGVCT
ncbi:hypothetical protein FHS29_004435 [Saccharothrix tamanrassetensis]|uniref:Uncharacterized protein n=1 Tax=Saccharothrix tamanrassetensis TaxID=1051531 RepID=A0A841CL72_9PSEU|nr:hypothetical protein [Saccharothrix tamanrassetensis]MBB5957840.1 hypothetical protein [Saccharothrix tamanrassetensis]